MGKYSALGDPMVDQVIEGHLQRIVATITSRMHPYSIILRGSFGRGEGSVLLRNGKLHFLSDYEIDVATFSSRYRSLFAELTQGLTAELGMQVGVRWTRPDCMTKDRIGPIRIGPASITISLYEFRYGSRILYGQDFLTHSQPIDPAQIHFESGFYLLLNRMAESLSYMTRDDRYVNDDLAIYYWINKTILACAESLLLFWKQYHYSYIERGKRFANLASECSDLSHEQMTDLSKLVAHATEFKLHPRQGLYSDTVRETWLQVLPSCDTVIRYLTDQAMHISFCDYEEYPEQFLRRSSKRTGLKSQAIFGLRKLYETYRAVKAHCFPGSIMSPFHASQIVYSVVPLLFLGYDYEKQAGTLGAARYWLAKLGPVKPSSSDPAAEWDYLRQLLVTYWKIYCY